MAKTLLLVRHAKSSWDDATLADFERPLNGRGLRAAPFMGEFLREASLVPALIVSSPAARARATAELVKDGGRFDAELTFDGRIYEASPRALREVAAEIPDEYDSVMFVGHNPGMEGFTRYLSGKIESMPTAAVAIIDLKIEAWDEVDAECGKLREVLRPKDLMRR